MATTDSGAGSSIPEDVVKLSGPFILGLLFGYGLFGILCIQVFTYHISFPNDSIRMKTLVFTMFLLELALIVLSTETAWYTFGSGFGDITRLQVLDSTMPVQTLLTGICTSIFHGFYCRRIFKLTGNYIFPTIIAVTSLAQLVMTGVECAYNVSHHNHVAASMETRYKTLLTVWFAFTILADTLITTVMVTLLLTYRDRSVYKPTRRRVQRVIAFTIETGLFISCAAILQLVLFWAFQGTLWNLVVFFALSKTYSNSLMAIINSRKKTVATDEDGTFLTNGQIHSGFWREGVVHVQKDTVVLSDLSFPQPGSGSTSFDVIDVAGGGNPGKSGQGENDVKFVP